MTDSPVYYYNFARCEAVQYDGTNVREIDLILGGTEFVASVEAGDGYHEFFPEMIPINESTTSDMLHLGQWLIRQDGRMWVQSEEPARVEHWEWGVGYIEYPTERFAHNDEMTARALIERFSSTLELVRRPVFITATGVRWACLDWEIVATSEAQEESAS